MHPIRSVRAEPVKTVYLGPYGFKFDREIVLIDEESKKPVSVKEWL